MGDATTRRNKILIVDDDASLAEMLQLVLRQEGFETVWCATGDAALQVFRDSNPDLVLLDLMLPGINGVDVCRRIRGESGVPIVMLTAKSDTGDVVDGLQAGADDYLGKPFHMEELVARIQALLRRAAPAQAPQLQVGKWRLDEGRQRLVDADGREQTLTATEFRLLRYFMRHPDVVHSKSHLAEHVYDFDAERDSNVIEVYVCRLRILLGNERIETRRGQGYLFRGQS